jgi:hypothetical protein
MLCPPLPIAFSKWIVRCWDPDHGVVTCQELDAQIPADDDQTEAGWVTYLSNRCYPIQIGPQESVQVDSVNGLGRLICISADRYSSSDPIQIALIKSVFSSLNQ